MRNKMLVISTLMICMTILIAFLVSRSITGPIRLLTTAARIRGEGDLGYRVEIKSRDEIGELSDTFNTMAEKRQEFEAHIKQYAARLEAANKELEAFSYSVSHDLRAPLRAIDSFARILIEDHSARLDDEGLRVVNVITTNIQKMGQLIDDLLAFSRLDRKTLKRSKVNMDHLVENVVNEFRLYLGKRTVKWMITPLGNVMGDWSMLREVFLNLVSNAVKFTRQKETGTIEIGRDEGDDEIVYYVRDNGAGFNMRYADKLFKVFQRLHGSKEFEGTGIGLALCERIINKHGGRIWAKGEPDKGAGFYFSLPK